MTRPGGSDLSPAERAARVFTPKVRGIEINREGTERKRECVRRGGIEWVGARAGVCRGGRVVEVPDGSGGEVRASCKLAGLAD